VGLSENKRFVIVSNNVRNRAVEDVVGVRLTTAVKPDLPSIVRFGPGEVGPTECYAVADDIWLARKEWLSQQVGALTPAQMIRIDQALHAALDLHH
jgi:mRNA-degrading endonuclease toxin of MazEF toxin-antitoxin module